MIEMPTTREHDLGLARSIINDTEGSDRHFVGIAYTLARRAIKEAKICDALLAACECQAAADAYGKQEINRRQLREALAVHGYNDQCIHGPSGFINDLRDNALKLAREP